MYLGLDIGSSSSKAVLLGENQESLAAQVVNLGTGTKGVGQVLEAVYRQAGIGPEEVRYTVVTGYGRMTYQGADRQITEISCHAKGVFHLSSCRRKGLAYQGVLEVIMPENYIALFSAPEKAEAQAILRKALPTLNQGAVWIAEGKPFPEKRVTCLDRLKSGLVNRVFYQFVIRAKPFYSTEACTGCGRCVELCPLNNIHLAERHPHWGNRCTHCMACICGCPAEAVEYGRRSRGKVRYWCPEDHRA